MSGKPRQGGNQPMHACPPRRPRRTLLNQPVLRFRPWLSATQGLQGLIFRVEPRPLRGAVPESSSDAHPARCPGPTKTFERRTVSSFGRFPLSTADTQAAQPNRAHESLATLLLSKSRTRAGTQPSQPPSLDCLGVLLPRARGSFALLEVNPKGRFPTSVPGSRRRSHPPFLL